MIIEEITESDFIKRFDDYNRGNNFSVKGRCALYEYFDELYTEEEPFKLDVISICCDFNEYEDIENYLNDYYTAEQKAEKINKFIEENDYLTEEEKAKATDLKEFDVWLEEDLNNKTTLIKLGDSLNEGFIIQAY